MDTLALFFLVSVAIGGVVWVFVYPILSGDRKAEKRQEGGGAHRAGGADRRRAVRAKSRREQVEGTLKDLEVRRTKAKSVPLSVPSAKPGSPGRSNGS